ncbi:MAG: hypothetical protein WCH75_12220, partial [Candidatus Binatia bacterium]
MTYLNTPLARFFVASITLHLIFLLLIWQQPSNRAITPDTIAVSLLPAQPEENKTTPSPAPTVAPRRPSKAPDQPEESKTTPSPAPRVAPSRPSKAPAQVAKKNSPVLREKPVRKNTTPQKIKPDRTAIPREVPEEKA